jgi:hypothetical protein
MAMGKGPAIAHKTKTEIICKFDMAFPLMALYWYDYSCNLLDIGF